MRLVPLAFLTLGIAASHANTAYIDLDSIQYRLACTEKIVVLREKHEHQYIHVPPRRAVRNDTSIGADLFAKFEDNYDFLLYFPQVDIGYAQASKVDQAATGLGFYHRADPFLHHSDRVKSTGEFGYYFDYRYLLRNPSQSRSMKVDARIVLHELGHYWCCYMSGFYEDPAKKVDDHWHGGVQLFGEDTLLTDPMLPFYWALVGTEYKRVYSYPQNVGTRFSELTQYLMGFRGPHEVQSIKVHVWDTSGAAVDSKEGLPIHKKYGPTAAQAPDFLRYFNLTIEDFIALHGPRKPAYAESQRHFNVLPIIVVPYGSQLDTGYVEYLRPLLDTLPKVWAKATDERSTLRLGCDLHVGTRSRSRPKPFQVHLVARERAIRLIGLDKSPEQAQIDLVDLRGRALRNLYRGDSRSIPDRIGLPRQAFPPGAYFVKVALSSMVHSERIVLMD